MSAPIGRSGLTLIELLISLSLFGLFSLLLSDVMLFRARYQAKLNSGAEETAAIQELQLALRHGPTCSCSLSGKTLEELGRGLELASHSAGCARRGATLAGTGHSIGPRLKYRSLRLKRWRRVTPDRVSGEIEAVVEIRPADPAKPPVAREHLVPISLALAEGADQVAACGTQELRGPGRYQLVHEEVRFKGRDDNEIRLPAGAGFGAVRAILSGRGIRRSQPPLPRRAQPKEGAPAELPEIRYGSDLESFEIEVDFERSRLVGTYRFAGGPRGALTAFAEFEASIASQPNDFKMLRGRMCVGADPTSASPQCGGILPDPYSHVSYNLVPIVFIESSRGGPELLIRGLGAQHSWEQLWTARYYAR